MLLYLLFKLACLGVCMAYLTPMRFSGRKSVLYVFCFQSAIYIANCAIYILVGEDVYKSFSLVSIAAPGFFCFNYLARRKGFSVLFTLLTVAVFGMLASFLGYVAQVWSGSPALEYFVRFSSFILIIVYVAKVIKKPYLKLIDTLQKGWGFISLIPLVLIGIINILQYTPTFRPENIPVLSLVFAMTFVFYTIVFLNFKNILDYLQIRQEKELMTVQAQMYKSEYKALIGHVDSMRMFRHDIRHHLGAFNAFLQDGNIKEAKEYLKKLDGSLNNGNIRKYCENYAVNAILSSLISRANSEGVSVDCRTVISEDIAIDSMDLGLIFANALDNAINACRKLTDPALKKILVNCREHCGQLHMCVSNPFAGDVHFDGEFPISEDREHGIGTRSIASITEKYDGSFSFTAKKSVFYVMVTLNEKTPAGA